MITTIGLSEQEAIKTIASLMLYADEQEILIFGCVNWAKFSQAIQIMYEDIRASNGRNFGPYTPMDANGTLVGHTGAEVHTYRYFDEIRPLSTRPLKLTPKIFLCHYDRQPNKRKRWMHDVIDDAVGFRQMDNLYKLI